MNTSRTGTNDYSRTITCRLEPAVEGLESRLLLDAAPTLGTPLPTSLLFGTNGAITIGVDGADADGDNLTITAVGENPNLAAYIPQHNPYARLHFVGADGTTPVGDILVQLFKDRIGEAADRFITLSTKHVNADKTLSDPTPAAPAFYTDVLVHRVIPGFMIQTGDAEKGDGTGASPLGKFNDYFDPVLSFAGPGALAMANSGADTNDCQFFITADSTPWMDRQYVIFGQVISGWAVYDTLINSPTPSDSDRPTNPPILQSVEVIPADQGPQQDATVTLRAINGFVGETRVKVTLDDGHNKYEKWIPVTVLGIADPGDFTIAEGADFDFVANVIEDSRAPLVKVEGSADLSTATVSVDATTHKVSVTVPDDFVGMFRVDLSASYQGVTTATRSFYVYSQVAHDPPVLGQLDVTVGGSAMNAFRAGNLMYVASGENGLEIYDVSAVSNPRLLGTYDTPGSARNVQVVGGVAYVADTFGGLISLNVADPAHIVKLDGEDIGSVAVNVAVQGSVAFVAGYEAGLVAYSIADPANLTKLGQITQISPTFSLSQVVDVVLKDGKYAIVSDLTGGCAVIDVTHPQAMTCVSAFGTGGSPWGMDLRGSLLYVADQFSGLVIVNLARIDKPTMVARLGIGDSPWQITLTGQTAILGTATGLVFVDISNPAYMISEYKFPTSGGNWNGKAMVWGTQVAVPASRYGVVFLEAASLLRRITIYGAATFNDGNNIPVTIRVRGGVARAYPTSATSATVQKLDFIAYSTNASLSITTRGGQTSVGDINVYGPLVSLSGPAVNLQGDLTDTGTLRTLTLNNVADDHKISINTSRAAFDPRLQLSMTLGQVTDCAVDTNGMPIKSLRAVEWLDTLTPDKIKAPWIGSLVTTGRAAKGGLPAVAGNFQAGLELTATGSAVNRQGQIVGNTLNKATIAGSRSGTWSITSGMVGSLSVTGTFAGSLTAKSVNSMSVKGNLDTATINLSQTADPKIMALRTLNVGGLVKGTAISCPGNVGTVSVGGNFGGSLAANSVQTMTVKGNMEGATVTLNQLPDRRASALSKLNVTGWIKDTVIKSVGNINSVTAGGMNKASIFAGLGVSYLPSRWEDFSFTSVIGSVTVKGIKQGTAYAESFIDSNIAAWQLGSITINYPRTIGTNGVKFGMCADSISRVSIKDAQGVHTWSSLTDWADRVNFHEDMEIRVV